MSKQFYFAVCVEEDGTTWIDHDLDIHYGAGNVWDSEVQDWCNSWDEENVENAEHALARLSAKLKEQD